MTSIRKNPETGLTAQQERFAVELAKGGTQASAYRAAYPQALSWKPKSLHEKASVLAANVKVQERVSHLMSAAARANEVEVADVLRWYLNRVKADPRELVTYVWRACRYCHGTNHQYHYTAPEMRRAMRKHADKRHALLMRDKPDIGEFDEEGGLGYDELAAPHTSCPVCHGRGEGRMVINDLSNLSPEALSIYAGVKEGKDGIQVLLASKDKALEALARHVGFFEKDNEVTVGVFEADALEAKFRAGMQRSMERQAAMLAERRKTREG